VAFDHSKVLDYAERYWMEPCDDGFICSSTTPGGRLSVDQKRQELYQKGLPPDCGMLHNPTGCWQAVFLPDDGERACFIPVLRRARTTTIPPAPIGGPTSPIPGRAASCSPTAPACRGGGPFSHCLSGAPGCTGTSASRRAAPARGCRDGQSVTFNIPGLRRPRP
jgi:hypothetical protein